MVKLSKRLMAIAQQVAPCAVLVDVGTDHGYIPIALVQQGTIQTAIACDVSKDSLDKAKANINRYNLPQAIEARCGDGLRVIGDEEPVGCIVMAGMGGMLMIDLLKQSPIVVSNAAQLVLQPQLDVPDVRKFVHHIGYQIVDEEMVYEESKYYTVLQCAKGREQYTEREYMLGKILIDKKCAVLQRFLIHDRARIQTLLAQIDNDSRRHELMHADAVYKEVLDGYENCGCYESDGTICANAPGRGI